MKKKIYKTEILAFDGSPTNTGMQEEINDFIKDKTEVINVSTSVSSGGMLGGGCVIATILYKE